MRRTIVLGDTCQSRPVKRVDGTELAGKGRAVPVK